jgi:hypothetical protein
MSILKIKEEKLITERTISVEDLKKAISLKCANCYAAMSFANALGGSRTDAWYLCHAHTLKELLDEANTQGVDLSDVKSSIDNIPVKESLYYKRATGDMTEQEFKAAFSKWQRGEK